MLKLTLCTTGTLPRGPFTGIGDEFSKRLKKFVIFNEHIVRSNEKLELIAHNSDYLIVLDAEGKAMNSNIFASTIQKLEDEGRHVTVILGGPFGLTDEIKNIAHLRLSLSPMTTTHDLAHLFFLEQLYRACTINKQMTYHY